MDAFVYNGLPVRVLFGYGTQSKIAEELQRLECRRALIIATPFQKELAEQICESLGEAGVASFPKAVMHTPVDVTEQALAVLKANNIDCLVSAGGGSAIGLGKALALRTDLPQIAVPTSYAGSEMTTILGQTEDGRKTTQRSMGVLPETVIYDVSLTETLPVAMSVTSGMNAVAHAIEAIYAQDRNPIITTMSLEAIRSITEALPKIARNPKDRDARTEALYGAWLCGIALGSTNVALHHKLCHTLGGSFDLPHAETHTVVLPHVTAFNASAVNGALAPVAEILGADHPGQGLFDLAKGCGAPLSLAEIGMPEDGIAKAAEIAMKNPYWNPREFTEADIRTLLEQAYHGQRPSN